MKPQHILFVTLLMLATAGCSPTAKNEPNKRAEHVPANGIYYWKTIFDLNETERNFLKEHHVKRLYLRFFDVVPAEINSYVSQNYPGQKILKIDRSHSRYEVDLSNGLELKFNKRFKLVEIDN